MFFSFFYEPVTEVGGGIFRCRVTLLERRLCFLCVHDASPCDSDADKDGGPLIKCQVCACCSGRF